MSTQKKFTLITEKETVIRKGVSRVERGNHYIC